MTTAHLLLASLSQRYDYHLLFKACREMCETQEVSRRPTKASKRIVRSLSDDEKAFHV